MTNARLSAVLVALLLVCVAATIWLAHLSPATRDAAIAVATVATGLATAAAAFYARDAAVQSANAARTARVALAKHSPSDLVVTLVRHDGGPWTWWIALRRSPMKQVRDVRLTWRASGNNHSDRTARLDEVPYRLPENERLNPVWQVPALAFGDPDVHTIADAIGAVQLSWLDTADPSIRWVMDGEVINPEYEPSFGIFAINTMDAIPGKVEQAIVEWLEATPVAS